MVNASPWPSRLTRRRRIEPSTSISDRPGPATCSAALTVRSLGSAQGSAPCARTPPPAMAAVAAISARRGLTARGRSNAIDRLAVDLRGHTNRPARTAIPDRPCDRRIAQDVAQGVALDRNGAAVGGLQLDVEHARGRTAAVDELYPVAGDPPAERGGLRLVAVHEDRERETDAGQRRARPRER